MADQVCQALLGEFHVKKVSEAKTYHTFNLRLFSVVAFVVIEEICIQ